MADKTRLKESATDLKDLKWMVDALKNKEIRGTLPYLKFDTRLEELKTL